MDNMIRDNEPHIQDIDNPKPYPSAWLWCLGALAVFAVVVAAFQARALGWQAFLFSIGVGIVSVAGLASLLFGGKSTATKVREVGQVGDVLSESFRALKAPSIIVQNGKPIYSNKAYLKLAESLGADLSELDVPPVDRLFSKKEKSASAALFRLYHAGNENEVAEEVIRTLDIDGTFRTFSVRVTALKEGQLWQINEKTNEEVVSKPLYSEAPIGLFSVKPDGEIVEMNSVLCGWLGIEDGNEPENIAEFIESPKSLLDSQKTVGRTVRSDTRLITNKGVVSPTIMVGTWQEMESGDLFASVAVYGHSGVGMRTLAGAESTSNQSRTNIENLADETDLHVLSEAPFGVVKLDSTDLNSAKVTNSNSGFVAMVEEGSTIGVEFASLFETADNTDRFLSSGLKMREAPIDVHLKGKARRPVNVYFSTPTESGCMAYIVDVSARKQLEHQLVQSQKMQAIGQLAGGVAHDFNNLLTAIRLNTDDLLGRHPVGDPSYPELQKINQTVARAAGLVRKLLAFSRKQTLRTQTLDVTETLSDLTVLLQQVMVERVKLDVVHGRGLPAIQADKGQLETVLMNLCVNARDATVEKGQGGKIEVRSVKPTDTDLSVDNIPPRKEGGYVLIRVTDSGTGMDAETQKKIFEPFFTTKEQGKGTGLGLATVYGIVEQSGGHLRVESELGVGTSFKVYIPTATGKDKVVVAPKKPVVVKPSDLAGQGLILFVEDEDAVRSIAAKTLRKRGYTVTEAGDGEEALEILEEATEPFDLMISDVVMPGMDGPTLLKEGRSLLGDARIVFISGYAEEEFSELLAEEPDVTFLPKPFTLTQLAEKVKTVIGEPV